MSFRLCGTIPPLQLAGSFQLPLPPIHVLVAAKTGLMTSDQMITRVRVNSENVARYIGWNMAPLQMLQCSVSTVPNHNRSANRSITETTDLLSMFPNMNKVLTKCVAMKCSSYPRFLGENRASSA